MAQFLFTGGKDKQGRAVVIFNAARHFIGGDLLETLQLAIYAIEEAIKSMEGSGQYQILLIEDLTGFKKSENSDMKMIKFLADAAQTHYPCRIGKFYAVNSPWYYNVLFTVVKPWLNDDLASIVNIVTDCKPLLECTEADQLPKYLGGTLDVGIEGWVEETLDAAKDLEDNRVIAIETQVMLGCSVVRILSPHATVLPPPPPPPSLPPTHLAIYPASLLLILPLSSSFLSPSLPRSPRSLSLRCVCHMLT